MYWTPGRRTNDDADWITRPALVDEIDPVTGKGRHGSGTLEDARREHGPETRCDLWSVAAEGLERAFSTFPQDISEDRWCELLDVLPPVAWVRHSPVEQSFRMREKQWGRVTTHVVRWIDGTGVQRFATFDSVPTEHSDAVAYCRAALGNAGESDDRR